MPLRPSLRPSYAPKVAEEAEIPQRPQLERYEPVRSSDASPLVTMAAPMRTQTSRKSAPRQQKDSETSAAPRLTPNTPAEETVANAYEVIAKYLEEGRQYAAGQSAWNNGQSGLPEGWSGAVSNLADALGALGRLWAELARTSPTVLGSKNQRAAPFHPQQHPKYPARTSSAPPSLHASNTLAADASDDMQSSDEPPPPPPPNPSLSSPGPVVGLVPTNGWELENFDDPNSSYIRDDKAGGIPLLIWD